MTPCEDVAVNPPGQGVTTAPNGAITGQVILSDGLHGALRIDAVVLRGGSYDGVIVRR